MKMNKKFYLGFMILIVFSIMVSACQPAATATSQPASPTQAPASSSSAPSVYKIGFSGPLTGDGAYYGQAEKEGIDLAVDEINKAGGVKGVPISVIYEDDRNDTADAQTVLLKLAQIDKVPLIIGINTSSVTMATCKKAEELQVVQYSIGSNPKIGSSCSDYSFLLQGNDLEQGLEFAKIGQFLKMTSAAVVYMNNDYGIGNKDAFVNAAKTAGINILGTVPLQPGGKDYRTEVLQVKSMNPPMVAFVAYGAEGSVFLRQAKEEGLQTKFVGDTNWGDSSMWSLGGDALVGMVGLQAGAHTSPEYQKFAAAFKAKYNKDTSIWSEYFYDEIYMAAKAIEMGGYTGPGIKDATKKIAATFVGASGSKQLDAQNYVRWSFDWVEWQPDGTLKPVQH
jgi:ABC-type branched-subunit amino acid transport system substrate-binding protein